MQARFFCLVLVASIRAPLLSLLEGHGPANHQGRARVVEKAPYDPKVARPWLLGEQWMNRSILEGWALMKESGTLRVVTFHRGNDPRAHMKVEIFSRLGDVPVIEGYQPIRVAVESVDDFMAQPEEGRR